MKKLAYLIASLVLIAGCDSDGGSSAGASGSGELTTAMDSMSYGVGAYFSQQFQNQGIGLNGVKAGEGFSSGFGGNTMTPEYQNVIVRYQMAMQARQGAPFTDSDPLNVDVDSLSYAIGLDFGSQMKDADMAVNGNAFQQGCSDLVAGNGKLDDQGIQNQLQNFSMMVQQKQQAVAAEKAVANKEKGKTFIAEKAQEEGVVATASGLHYKVLKAGSGASPKATDQVTVHYEGRLIDGTIFDSSYQRGNPAEFGLNQVISGWTEGVQLMKPGAKYQFYIPSDLAYGDRGSPPNIGPGETLIFDVELLEVK